MQQGPIIEQGTHIVDLSRYFGGDVDMDTVWRVLYRISIHKQPGPGLHETCSCRCRVYKLSRTHAALTPSRHTRSPGYSPRNDSTNLSYPTPNVYPEQPPRRGEWDTGLQPLDSSFVQAGAGVGRTLTRTPRRKYESGAVGTLLHATALHGVDYAIELEVYADGVGVCAASRGDTSHADVGSRSTNSCKPGALPAELRRGF